jgi:hypothetical protein
LESGAPHFSPFVRGELLCFPPTAGKKFGIVLRRTIREYSASRNASVSAGLEQGPGAAGGE